MNVREALLQPGAHDRRRARTDTLMLRIFQVTAFLAVLPLFALVFYVTLRAIPWLGPSLLFHNPLDKEPGILNAIVGSLQMTGLAILITGPIGVAGGVYLSEFAPKRVASIGEFVIDIMLGIPSIVAGIFAFLVLVPLLGFSGWAGSAALSVLTLPIVMRTTQEVMRLVPPSIREASLALGVPVWRTTLYVTVRTALPGVLTGLVLAASRGLGETAPLLMTAHGTNAENFLDFGTTMNAMPIVIYQYANAADDRSIGQAWATALVLMALALALNVLVRWRTVNSRVA
ncbi:MAG: phosphate ABC transporter permease PstA [Chloroflexota bacterium]